MMNARKGVILDTCSARGPYTREYFFFFKTILACRIYLWRGTLGRFRPQKFFPIRFRKIQNWIWLAFPLGLSLTLGPMAHVVWRVLCQPD